MSKATSAVVATVALAVLALTTTASGRTSASTCDGRISGTHKLTAWFHSGTGDERTVLQSQVDAFNASQSQVQVDLKLLPEGNYNDQVKAAAAAGGLPDILDFDGPFLYNYAWNKNLVAIGNCVSASLKASLLPSIVKQGTYAGKLYGVGTFDSGLGLYSRRSVLRKAGVRIPTSPGNAWTTKEFTAVLKKLKAQGFQRPLDLKYNYGQGEWFTYGFSPAIQSAGGDLINRKNYRTASGVLNSPASVRALTIIQGYFKAGLVDPNTADDSFVKGNAAISWVGHWQFTPYREAFGKDLVVLPLPNFGKGSRTGQGSWQWGITSNAADADAAWSFIRYLLQTKEILRMTNKNGAVPATKPAAAASSLFKKGGPLHLYIVQLQTISVPRPQTPAYPVITTAFAKAFNDISRGANVKSALNAAVKTIDQDIKDNNGYPTG